MSVYKRIPIAMSKGRAILEYDGAMCRVTINLQGMPTDRLCKPYLLWDNVAVPLPKPLFVDKNGKCALRCELEAENPHKIRAVAITDDSLNCIDIGFTREKYNWQQCFMAKEEEPEPNKSKSSEDKKMVTEPTKSKAPTEDEQTTEPVEDKTLADNEKAIAKPADHAVNATEKKEVFKSIVCRLGEDIRELQEYARMPDNTEHLFESRNKVSPFYGCEGVWIKINLRDLAYAGDMWKYINNPLVLYACRKYHHLILGKGAEGLMLGIPWEYDTTYRLEAEIQGFNIIKPIENTSPGKGTMCYLITTM